MILVVPSGGYLPHHHDFTVQQTEQEANARKNSSVFLFTAGSMNY